GEVGHAVAWESLNEAQKQFQPIKMALHAAMIHRMDIEIGRVLEQLKAMRALENTAIFFLSDNGASAEEIIRGDRHDPAAPPGSAKTLLSIGPAWAGAANTPFRLHKSWVHEGGISSPLIAHWPNGIADRGKLRHNTCHFVDVLPTLIDLARGDPAARNTSGAPPLAGKSIAPVFSKDGSVKHEFIYFNHANNRAIRVGDMKLVAAGASGPWELYDLRTDRAESKNLASSQPGKASELAALWKQRDDEFVRQ